MVQSHASFPFTYLWEEVKHLKTVSLATKIASVKKRKVLLASAVILVTFLTGVVANPVFVQNISNISSGEHKVGGAHLAVNFGLWVIDSNTSTVEGVILRVNNTDTVAHAYQMEVQVSCLSSGGPGFLQQFFPPKPFICAGGLAFQVTTSSSGTITTSPVIVLGPGNSTAVGVNFNRAIEPELTQIEDLSFIVTELPRLSTTITPGPITIGP